MLKEVQKSEADGAMTYMTVKQPRTIECAVLLLEMFGAILFYGLSYGHTVPSNDDRCSLAKPVSGELIQMPYWSPEIHWSHGCHGYP